MARLNITEMSEDAEPHLINDYKKSEPEERDMDTQEETAQEGWTKGHGSGYNIGPPDMNSNAHNGHNGLTVPTVK